MTIDYSRVSDALARFCLPRKSGWTQKRIYWLKKLVDEGKTISEIAEIMKTTFNIVDKGIKKFYPQKHPERMYKHPDILRH